jgi:hypothetical protein
MKKFILSLLLLANVAFADGRIKNGDIYSAANILFSKMAPLTASRACMINSSGVVQASPVTDTELGYVAGATSNLQTQISAISGAAISIGTYDSQAKDAKGGVLTSNVLYFQSADATHPGMMSTGTQTIAGAKTFSGGVVANVTGAVTGNADTASAFDHTPTGCGVSEFATDIAANGDLTCAAQAGGGDVTGPASATDNAITRFNGTTGKSVQNSGATIDDSGNITATNLSGTNTGDITLGTFGSAPNAKGATLSSQVLTLQPADDTHPGLIDTATQTIAGAKTFSTSVITDVIQGTLTGPAIRPSLFRLDDNDGNAAVNWDADTLKDGSNVLSADWHNRKLYDTDGTTVILDWDARTFLGAVTGNASTASAFDHNPSACSAGTFASDIAADGTLTCGTPAGAGDVVGPASSTDNAIARFDSTTGKLLQNSGATIDDSGNITANSFVGPVTGNASTATALASNPSDCSANQFATTIAANGNLTCAQPAFTNISGTATVAQTTVATQALTTCTTARTVDWSTGNAFTLSLTSGNTCTLTFSNPTSGQTITIWLTNDAASSGTAAVTWPTMKWKGGAPTMTTGTSKLDVCTVTYNGTSYAGSCLQDMQ